MRIVVMYGSVRHHRQGIRAARWILSVLRERGHETYLADAQELRLPMLDRMYKEFEAGEAPEAMEGLARELRRADAFVVVSGEYNHGIPPAMKNMLDHFQKEYFWRPAGIVTYSAGHAGGARVQVALRATLGELGMITMPTIVGVPKVSDRWRGWRPHRLPRSVGDAVGRRAGMVRARPGARTGDRCSLRLSVRPRSQRASATRAIASSTARPSSALWADVAGAKRAVTRPSASMSSFV